MMEWVRSGLRWLGVEVVALHRSYSSDLRTILEQLSAVIELGALANLGTEYLRERLQTVVLW